MFKIVELWGLEFFCTDGAWSLLDDSDEGVEAMLALCRQFDMTSERFWQVAPYVLRAKVAKIEADEKASAIQKARRLLDDSFRV